MLEVIQSMDEAILLFIQENLRFAWLNGPMIFAGTLANHGIFWLALGVLLTVIPKTRKFGIYALASIAFCFLFNNLLIKNLVARPRPYTHIPELVMLMPLPGDFSFPSGHSCASFAAAGSFLWNCRGKWNWLRWSALALAIWIAYSRLYVGVHYPTDVLVGSAIGLLGSWIVCKYGPVLVDKLRKRT